MANKNFTNAEIANIVALVMNALNAEKPKASQKGNEAPRSAKPQSKTVKASKTAQVSKQAQKVEPIKLAVNGKVVTANRYLPNAIYKQNEAIITKLGGTIITGVGEFRAEFPSNAKAKAFVEQAITSMTKSEYNKTRNADAPAKSKPASTKKTQPKVEKSKKSTAKGKAKSGGKGKAQAQMTERQKQRMAYEMTTKFYGTRRVKHDTFMKRYNDTLASL